MTAAAAIATDEHQDGCTAPEEISLLLPIPPMTEADTALVLDVRTACYGRGGRSCACTQTQISGNGNWRFYVYLARQRPAAVFDRAIQAIAWRGMLLMSFFATKAI
eukprot:scaffold619_cov150-Skeletonema_menzelii.AAC.8